MLEDYLSIQLNNLEQEIAKAKKRIEENNHMLSEAAIHAKELSSKLDPSMEVFSPLRVNDTIKKNIRSANETIDKAKTDIELDKNLIDELENQRISLVTMLANFRQDKYKLQRYENCKIPKVLAELQQHLQKAQKEVVSAELSKIHSDCMQLITDCMAGLISRNKPGSPS